MQTISVDGVLDIETSEWDTFTLGAVLYADGYYYETRDENELFEQLLMRGGQIWSHNGGLFDNLWFLDVAQRAGKTCTVSLGGSRVTRVNVTGTGLILRDSFALAPLSLEKLAPMVNRAKGKPDIQCHCGRNCGGYCSISPKMSESMFRKVGGYLRDDCEILLSVLQRIFEYSAENSILLAGTIGGTAWKTARAELGLPKAEWPTTAFYKIARESYFGGRTQVFQPVTPHGYRYDINSAYPAALSSIDLPCGDMYMLDSKNASVAFANGKDGSFWATVSIDKGMHVPPLPVRLASGRVCFPVGRVSGTWTGIELRYALEQGVKIERFGHAVTWAESSPIIKPFTDRIWSLRHAAGKKTPLGYWLKWLANSFTGKCAQSPETESAIIHPKPEQIKACPGGDCQGHCRASQCCNHRCSGRCRCWTPLGDGGIWTIPLWRISDCAHVQWSAYLTAATRIKLREQLIDDGKGGETAVYCDTDSCYATAPRTKDIGDQLGQWEFEGEMFDFEAIAPKSYRYRKPDGKTVARCKGLPGVNAEAFSRFAKGETVCDTRGIIPFKSGARRGDLFKRKTLSRSSHSDRMRYGDRILDHSTGLTRPQDTATLAEWK